MKPKTTAHQQPPTAEYFAASGVMMPATMDDEARTIELSWFAGAPIPRVDWSTGEEYDIALDPAACDLDRLSKGAPLLNQHMAYAGINSQLGVVRRGWFEDGVGKATVQFSSRADVTPVWEDVKSGILQNISFGAWIRAKKETTGKDSKRRQFAATDWEVFEISLVTVPADANAAFMAAQTEGRERIPHKEQRMEQPDTTGAANAPNEAALLAAASDGAKRERERASAIRAMAAPFIPGITETFVSSLIDGGVTLDAARSQIMDALAAEAATHRRTGTNPAATVPVDARDKFRVAIEAALDLRTNPGDRTLEAAGRDYAGFSLMETARECLAAAGVNHRGMSKNEIAGAALNRRPEFFAGMSTSDLPNILQNVIGKRLRMAYQAAPQTWKPFCKAGTVADYKQVTRVALSDVPVLEAVAERGEYTRTYVSDAKEVFSILKYGKIISFSREMIVNDDLSALARIPQGIGAAAARLESNLVWAVITGNAAMGDSIALFHASHSNLNTSASLALAGLSTCRAAMTKQTAPQGDILNLAPRFIMVPAALETTLEQLIYPTAQLAVAVNAQVPTRLVGSLVPIVEARLDADSATTWYAAADPAMIDTIEYCYLEGEAGLMIERKDGFEVDGIDIKARLDFVAKAIDWRGMAKNTA